ncbi:MAG: 2TM domain-containing protein [Promethearchaeota archaeon]
MIVEGFSEESLRKIAEKKINYRRSVKIHVSIYILINILLFLINFFFTPFIVSNNLIISEVWFIYPLLGWFIGLSVHITSYLLYARGVLPLAKRGVIFHINVYLTVILLLTVINYITYPLFYWVIFPLIFWGAGVIIHIIIYRLYFKETKTEGGETGKSKKEKEIEKEIEKMKKRVLKNKK